MGPYNPVTGEMLVLFRFDWCLVCKHQWRYDYPKKDEGAKA